jgi:hypothetical protein
MTPCDQLEDASRICDLLVAIGRNKMPPLNVYRTEAGMQW